MRNSALALGLTFVLGTLPGVAAPVPKTLTAGEERVVDLGGGSKMIFVWIPAGESKLGSTKAERLMVRKDMKVDEEFPWEKPESEEVRGTFKTEGFWLGKHPVTQSEYTALMPRNPSQFTAEYDDFKLRNIRDTSRYPVEKINWEDCQLFLKAMNGRKGITDPFGKSGKFVLPHEDQWEYACRGGKGNDRAFYHGNSITLSQANVVVDFPKGSATETRPPYRQTTPVGMYAKACPHPWGLTDMNGNVQQWCDNWYDDTKTHKVLRGGSWLGAVRASRSAARVPWDPTHRWQDQGFRVCFKAD